MSYNCTRTRQRKTRRGVLTFEWILLVALLVVGLIGGLAGLRNAVLDQLYDLETAVEGMNFSGSDNTDPHHRHAKDSAYYGNRHLNGNGPVSGNGLVSGNSNGKGNDNTNGLVSGNAKSNDNTNGDAYQLDPDAPSRDSAPKRDSPADTNAWWNSGYR